MAKLPIAAQLYTARDLLAQDYAGTVKQVGKIGYRYVELAGFGNLKTAKEVRKANDDAGLTSIGAHVMLDSLLKETDRVFEEAQILGYKNITVPWLGEDQRKTAADWKKFAKAMSDAAPLVQQHGCVFAYHNHSFEFEKFDGKSGMDIFIENSSPAVKFELDVYWVKHGGQDPVAYINKLGSRAHLLHLKDMAAGPEQRFAPVGSGILDFKAIIAAGEKAGASYGIVEQDNCYGISPIEALKTSFENLKKMGAV